MPTRAYSVPDIEEFYTQLSIDDYLESLRDRGIGGYRCKTIISGQMLEVEIYPLPKPKKGKRTKPEKPSRPAQRSLNDKNTQKYVVRIVNANFTSRDIWATLDYQSKHTPQDAAQAQRDIQNFIRRLKRHVKKNNLPELKYIYITEWVLNEKTGDIRAHHHIITNFADREQLEKIWGKGFRPQTRRLAPDDFGLTGLAKYIAKEETKEGNRKGTKRYGYSLNLAEPKEYIADHKVKKRDVAKLAKNQNEGQGFFEGLYSRYFGKSYNFIDMAVKYSDFITGAFIYVRMKQAPSRKGRSTGART